MEIPENKQEYSNQEACLMLLDTTYFIKYQQEKLNFYTNQPENKKNPAGYQALLVWMLIGTWCNGVLSLRVFFI